MITAVICVQHRSWQDNHHVGAMSFHILSPPHDNQPANSIALVFECFSLHGGDVCLHTFIFGHS